MKKRNLLLIPLVAIASFMGIFVSSLNNVEAANNDVCGASVLFEIIKKIDTTYNGNQTKLTNNSKVNLNYEFIKDGNGTNPEVGTINEGETITFTVDEGGIVYFTLQSDISDPCKGKAGSNVGQITITNEGVMDNPLYNNSICVNYRNKWGNDSNMRNAVPYCFSQKTYSTYTKEEVQNWINTAEKLHESLASNTNNDITVDSFYKKVDNVKKTDKLVCDAFSNKNYETMNKYYHIEKEKVNNCEVTCKEEIEVNFSDPVATQQGMCFQYLIEIKSKAVCNSSYKGAVPVRKQECFPTPVCKAGSKEFDAGGPNDEFDSCVAKCDGGKYSQKCIDSCYNEVYKTNSNKKLGKTDVKKMSNLYNSNNSFYEATKLNNSCPGPNDAVALYNYMQNDPHGRYINGAWYSDFDKNSICSVGPYYFRTLAQTQQTIAMWNGNFSYSGAYKGGVYGYNNIRGDGILRAHYKNNDNCNEVCNWTGNCPSNSPLTATQAQKEYEEEVKKYIAAKSACEQKAATCSNETTDYKIVVDNIDNDSDKNDDKETFSSSQKLNSTSVTGKFPSMVILTDGECEDGKKDDWHYHNIITFPGTWVNNKTGKTVHTMDKGHENFYTYVGNSYCTKLNSVPTNTAWYNWKVNQNGDSSVLTESDKNKIKSATTMNINGSIKNYGYFGWNFDVSCFYAVNTPDAAICSPTDPNYPVCKGSTNGDPSCSPTDPNCNKNVKSAINDFKFRPVALDNIFPNSNVKKTANNPNEINATNMINKVETMKNNNAVLVKNETREIGFNWTCGATNLENKDYIVQPVSVMNEIERLGDSIYNGSEYLDYHVRLTPETMSKVKKYNKKYKNYAQPTSDKSDEVLVAGDKKTNGITVYKSYFLHKVLNSSELLKEGLIGCNNEDRGSCPNKIDTNTSCYNEYMAQSAVLKGAN